MKRWLLCLLCGCASASKTMPAAAPVAQHGGGDPHAEIERLSAQIDQQRQQMALPMAATPGQAPVQPMSVPLSAHADAQCHPAPTQTCTDSCTISDSICDNAKKICDIATELPGDAWASNKCVEGNETCAAAKKRCCDCAP